MRTLSAVVAELTSQRVLAEIPVVTIQPVIDHTVPTLDKEYALSTHPINGFFLADSSERPFLLRSSFPIETMSHLPSPVGSGVDSLTRRIQFSLVNAAIEDGTLYELLTANARLDRALLLLDTLLVPTREMGTLDRFLSFITGGSAGDSVRFFEGRIDRVTSVGDVIEVRAKSDLPVTPWKLVTGADSDVRDRGLRMPLPLGKGALVRCVNLIIGAASSIQTGLAIGATQIVLADASEFPSSGDGMVNAEKVSWTGKNGNVLTTVSRAQSGTIEADHVVGAPMIELTDITLGISSHELSSVTDIFILSNTSGTTIELSSLLYTLDLADEVTPPGASGEPIVTVTIAANQLAAILNGVLADAAVTQQASYVTAADPDLVLDNEATTTADNTTPAGTAGALGDWTTPTTAPRWTADRVGGDQDILRGVFTNGFGVNGNFGLRTARFDFTVDVISITSPITVGLTLTGAEGVLVGFVDGSVVASLELTQTGVVSVQGDIYLANSGQDVVDLEGVTLDFIRSEVPGGAQTIQFDVDDISCTFNYVDDLEPASSNHQPDTGTSVVDNDGAEGFWVSTTPSSALWEADEGDSRRVLEAEYTVDPAPDGPATVITGATVTFESTFSGYNGAPDDFEATLQFPGVWSQFLDTIPGIKTNDHGKTNGTLSQDIVLDVTDGATSADLVGVRFDYGGGPSTYSSLQDGFQMAFGNTTLELEFEVKITSVTLERSVDSQIQASAGGIGLQFFALCDGPEAPDGTYNAAQDDVLEHPGDLIRYWLETLHGQSNVDTATLSGSAYADATPGYRFGFDARNLGSSFGEVLLVLGYEGSANIAQPSGGDWTITFPNASFQFPTPTETLDSIGDLIAIGKDDDEIQTRLTVFSHFDPRFDSQDNRSFTEVQTSDPLAAAVVAREEEFGRKDAPPQFLLAHNATAGVTAWRLYQEQELGRFARIFQFRSDWWQGYAIEIGDMFNLSHPKVDGSALVKVRCIETQRSQERGIQLRFAEVL